MLSYPAAILLASNTEKWKIGYALSLCVFCWSWAMLKQI